MQHAPSNHQYLLPVKTLTYQKTSRALNTAIGSSQLAQYDLFIPE